MNEMLCFHHGRKGHEAHACSTTIPGSTSEKLSKEGAFDAGRIMLMRVFFQMRGAMGWPSGLQLSPDCMSKRVSLGSELLTTMPLCQEPAICPYSDLRDVAIILFKHNALP
jgi:hypothetical protein